jgi:hypothetical protein
MVKYGFRIASVVFLPAAICQPTACCCTCHIAGNITTHKTKLKVMVERVQTSK